MLGNVLLNVNFFFQNLSQDNFLNYQRFFTQTKNLNTARTSTEMEQNLLH